MMKIPEIFGIWTLGEEETVAEEEPAEVNDKAIYCPFCKKRMKMWPEGCTLWHIYCKECHFCLTMTTENGEILEKLESVIYE
jgi:hypothetical protein